MLGGGPLAVASASEGGIQCAGNACKAERRQWLNMTPFGQQYVSDCSARCGKGRQPLACSLAAIPRATHSVEFTAYSRGASYENNAGQLRQ